MLGGGEKNGNNMLSTSRESESWATRKPHQASGGKKVERHHQKGGWEVQGTPSSKYRVQLGGRCQDSRTQTVPPKRKKKLQFNEQGAGIMAENVVVCGRCMAREGKNRSLNKTTERRRRGQLGAVNEWIKQDPEE